ncbi:MAG: DUF1302 domain-containing protein [Rhodocyclaceae bacterium]|nr:DUF1302 domain-containing protein [Rhodocyclaceae bacterium]
MKTIATIRKTPLALAMAIIGIGAATPAFAYKFEMDNGVTGSFDSTISFGMQRRMSSPNTSMIGNDNGGNVPTSGPLGELVNGPGGGVTSNPDFNYTNIDDGNLNYKKGDIVSAVLKGTHELSLKDQGNWAALGRFTWSTDFAAAHTDRTPLDPEAESAVKRDVTLLDLWVSKDFSIGENAGKVKFGNQVISWGEDIFIFGGINSINAYDLRKAHIPGTQLKEIFIPAPMISVNTALAKGVSMEAYYQFAWNGFRLDPAGTYWSTADFLGKGGKRGAFIPSSFGGIGDFDPTQNRTLAAINAAGGLVPVEQTSPKNTGQFGLSMRFKPEDGDTEWAGYFIRYHDKLPFVGFRQDLNKACAGPGCLNIGGYTAIEQYGEDRSLFGVSMNTKVGEWAIGAELSYRPKDSVAIDPTVPAAVSNARPEFNLLALAMAAPTNVATVNGYVEEKKYQAHLTGFRFLPPEVTQALGAADGYVMAEAAVTRYPGLDLSGAIPYLLNDYTLPTKNSWGYVAEFGLTYANILHSGWTMSPVVDFYHDVRGVSPNTIPFIEGRKAIAVGLNFDYHNAWKASVGYTTFFGGGDLNLMRDRDVLSATVSYSF